MAMAQNTTFSHTGGKDTEKAMKWTYRLHVPAATTVSGSSASSRRGTASADSSRLRRRRFLQHTVNGVYRHKSTMHFTGGRANNLVVKIPSHNHTWKHRSRLKTTTRGRTPEFLVDAGKTWFAFFLTQTRSTNEKGGTHTNTETCNDLVSGDLHTWFRLGSNSQMGPARPGPDRGNRSAARHRINVLCTHVTYPHSSSLPCTCTSTGC